MWSHEESYKGFGITSYIHRKRLNHLFDIFKNIEINNNGKLGDFGCSNGYIISLLQKNIFNDKDYKFYGFDHSNDLIKSARLKKLPCTEFYFFNLNKINHDWDDIFDIVTCFETIEHTGNFKNALNNLYLSCNKGGIIILSIPNEKGLPGILKYCGRKLLRKNAYGDFFKNKSELEYIQHLLLNRRLDVFRDTNVDGWGPHLGFDWKIFKDLLFKSFIKENKLELLFEHNSFLNFNFFYILKKIS